MPKPSQLMTPRESEICARVNFVRKEIAKWSQPDMAIALGLNQNQMAGIEYKRVPLRYSTGRLLCEKFNINQRWMARGELPIKHFMPAEMDFSESIKPNALFSWVFDRFLDANTLDIERAIIKDIGEKDFRAGNFDNAVFVAFPPPGSTPGQAAAHYTKKTILMRMNWLPDDLLAIYSRALTTADAAFHRKYGDEIAKILPPAQRAFLAKMVEAKKSDLTEAESSNISGDVKAQLPELLERLKKATSAPGKKTELAGVLKAPLASVSRWLSGEREPGGEIALQMDAWATKQGHPRRPSK